MSKRGLDLLVMFLCLGLVGCSVDNGVYKSTLAQLDDLNIKNEELSITNSELSKTNEELTRTLAEKEEIISTFTQSVMDKDFEILLLSEKNNSLQSKLDAFNEKRESLENEIDQLKNGAPILLNEIKTYFERVDHLSVLSTAQKLHDKFNGFPEDIEGQALAKQSAIKVKEAEEAEEAARIAAEKEALKSAQEKARDVISINSARPSKPNSAGGVDVYITWKNNTDKVIKYTVFRVSAQNGVGDDVSCSIRGGAYYSLSDTGPFKKGQGNNGGTYWECIWYNSTIKAIRVLEASIEYMDGTTIDINGKDFDYKW